MNEPIRDNNGKYHYVYKITNNINNKIYIGKHSTCNLDDGYISSSPYVWNSIKKYGIENFTKKILQFCSSSEEAYKLEESLVTKEFCDRSDTYNLITGGKGFNSEDISSINSTNWKDPSYRTKMLTMLNSPEHRESMKEGQQKALKTNREKYTRNQKESWNRPEVRENHHIGLVNSWKDPSRIEKASKNKKEFWSNPENRNKISEKNKKFWIEHPEAREELSRKISEAHQRPEVREKFSKAIKEARSRPEVKQKFSDSSKKLWQDPEYVRKVKEGRKAKETEESREFRRIIRVIVNYFIGCKRAFGHCKPWMEQRYSQNFWRDYYLMKNLNKQWLLKKLLKERKYAKG